MEKLQRILTGPEIMSPYGRGHANICWQRRYCGCTILYRVLSASRILGISWLRGSIRSDKGTISLLNTHSIH
jgi:hypothetical protein